MRITLTAVFVLCAALVSASAGAGTAAEAQARKGRAASQRRAPAKQKPVATRPALPEVREIDEIGLKTLLETHVAGGRVLLVNFWATWCVPCREEFPDLVRIEEEFAGADVFEF